MSNINEWKRSVPTVISVVSFKAQLHYNMKLPISKI